MAVADYVCDSYGSISNNSSIEVEWDSNETAVRIEWELERRPHHQNLLYFQWFIQDLEALSPKFSPIPTVVMASWPVLNGEIHGFLYYFKGLGQGGARVRGWGQGSTVYYSITP